jgi:hypothetical protein
VSLSLRDAAFIVGGWSNFGRIELNFFRTDRNIADTALQAIVGVSSFAVRDCRVSAI